MVKEQKAIPIEVPKIMVDVVIKFQELVDNWSWLMDLGDTRN